MRKGRIWFWILCLAVALGLYVGEGWFRDITAEKPPLYVYAPKDMKSAFKRALKCAGMKGDYKIVITEDAATANIVVETDKEFDPEYMELAYSPFVVAYSNEDNNVKNMVKAGLLKDAFFDDDYKEIDFIKVIDEVLDKGQWSTFGVKNMGNLHVYYPAPGSEFYSDYYDFMLVTVNGGFYPKDEESLKKAIEKIALFEKSDYTEGVSNYDEKLERSGGFMENTFWLIPEKLAGDLASSNSEYGALFYPTTTVYTHWYIKADELGMKLVDVFDDPDTLNGNFYDYIEDEDYRNSWDNTLDGITDYLYNERDVYNVIHLESNRIRPDAVATEADKPFD